MKFAICNSVVLVNRSWNEHKQCTVKCTMLCFGISLIQAIRRKCQGLLSSGASLQHDNGRPQAPRDNVKQNQDLKLKGITPYKKFTRFGARRFSSHLTPKTASRGRHFGSAEEVKVAVHDWLA